MAKFIELHLADGTPKSINVDNILDFYPSVREESTRLNSLYDRSMYIYEKTPYDCTCIEFNVYKKDSFVARETYDEVCEKIKAATESDDTKKTSMDQSAYMVHGIE